MIKISQENVQNYKDIFADRLLEFMGDKNLTEWCKENGIPSETARCWLRKSSLPSIEYFAALAKEFGVSIDYLVGLED
ncbi:MAG: helix-turn-helix domain containing protein [Firmicutes bacterium]|nr:helix-turn-helix domain containing protein [Bacillota bacterium]